MDRVPGGTGCIGAAASRAAISRGFEVYLLNRGSRIPEMPGSHNLVADVERDIALFRGRTKQYVFISSASAYQKPRTITSSAKPRRQ